MVAMSMEHVHERACEQQQVGEDAEQVGPMLCQQEKERDRKKSGQDPSGTAGHAVPVFMVVWLKHDDPLFAGLETC
jgi:hypothetical protein